jgi:hypothetical protein
METRAFQPLYQPQGATPAGTGTLMPSVTVASTTSAVASTAFPGTTNNTQCQIQIANTTASWVFVNFGAVGVGNTVTAATVATGYPVAPGAVVVVSVAPEVNGASVIGAAGSAGGSVVFTRGEGL